MSCQPLEVSLSSIYTFLSFDIISADYPYLIVAASENDQDCGALVFFRREQVPYQLCDKLCNLSEAATHIFTLKKDLFDALVLACNKAVQKCVTHGFVSGAALLSMASSMEIAEGTLLVGNAADATICLPMAVVAGSIVVASSVKAVGHYKEKNALRKKMSNCENGVYPICPI
jgi:hypothetical protein